MKVTNNKPDFISIYKSMSDPEKRIKLILPFTIETGLSEDTWFRKVRLDTWSLLERKWIADKLELPIKQLFPNFFPRDWKNQPSISKKVENQLIG